MKPQILDKKSGARRNIDDAHPITLDRPSVVFLKLAPEKVARYERRGDDLVLVLKDGQEIAIQGFFVKYPDADAAEQAPADAAHAATDGTPAEERHARSDLVLEDDNGVIWWGQYPEQWTEFHFTEIEGHEAGIIWWPWLLGALGAVGVGALAAGSGGSGGHAPANLPPVATDDEARMGEDSGPVTGKLLANDSDPDGDRLNVTQFTVDGKTYAAGDMATIEGIGTITIGSDGSYTFTPEPNWSGSVPVVTYTVSDGKGGTDTADLRIVIDPATDLTAADDNATTNEDTPVSGTVAANDDTTSGGTLTFTKESDPGHGTVIINTDGTYTYTPDKNYSGIDSFTYTVTDPASGESQTQTVNITINPVTDLTAADDSATTNEDTPVSGTVATNDGTTSGGTLTFAKESDPGHGTVVVNADGTYTYTPDKNYSGIDSFTYTVTDPASGESQTQTVNITINPVTDLTAADDSATTNEDTPVSGTVATNDGTTSGGTLTFAKESDPGHGTVIINTDGTYTYTPDKNYNGTDSFTYTVTDPASGESLIQTVNITINPVNDAPAANGAIADQNDEDATGVGGLDVSSFFSDVDGDTLHYSATNLPEGLSIDPNTGVISGTIDPSASQGGMGGIYSVTVTATDGSGLSVDRTFSWTVTNPAPLAHDDTATTNEDIPVSGNVIAASGTGDAADTDPDGDSLSVTGFTIAGDATPHSAGETVLIAGVGTFTLGSDGAYTFTPDAGWEGTVPAITYTISDGEGGSDTANLTITVVPVNHTPDAHGTIADQTSEDADGVGSLDVSSFFSDVDGDTLHYSASNLPEGLSIDPNTGVISGTIDPSASQGGMGGIYSVTVTATDGGGLSVDRTFSWTVTNPAPLAHDDAATTNEDTPVSGNVITASGPGDVADTDPDGDSLSVTGFTIAGDATPHSAGETVMIAGVGTFTLGSDGAYTFTPAANWNGSVPAITYTISDGEGGSDTANLTITVTPVPDAPVISGGNQSGAIVEAGNLDDGTVVAGTPDASGSFTATDADGDSLTWTVLGTPDATYGTFDIDPATGGWTYTLDNMLPATQALNEGDSIALTYDVQVSDGNGGTATRTVTITITGTNDAPVANADTAAVTEAGVEDGGNIATAGAPSATGNVLTNDTDVDDGEKATLAVSDVSFGGSTGTLGSALTGTYGSLTLNGNGTFTYTLDNSDADTQALKQGQSATEEFSYTVVDANGATSTSTLTITVTGTNDQPVITSNAAAAAGDVTEQGTANPTQSNSTTGTLTASDVDADATQAWSIATTTGTYGSIAIDPVTGQWTYTLDNGLPATQALNTGETRIETFTARVTDDHGAYSEQVITITVHGSNDNLAGTGAETIPLTEDGSAAGTLQDYVSDVDDIIVLTGFTVDTNGDGVDESFAPGDTATIKDADGNILGTLTIEESGDYDFTPTTNYAGTVPTVTYVMAEDKPGGASVTQTVTFEIAKTADAPALEAGKTVNTNEDTAVSLGLQAPVITDTGTGTVNNDNSERLGAITLAIGGAGATGVTLSTGAQTLTPIGGKVTIVLTDVDHIASVPAEDNANGVYYLTTAQYEAILAHPAAESGNDFTVTISVTSYEVDGTGAILPGVAGATSTQAIDVDVQAVTDGATLTTSQTSLSFAEDSSVDLSGLLTAARADTEGNGSTDMDGSERYSYTVSGLPTGTVVTINGMDYTAGASGSVTSTETSSFTAAPSLIITPPSDFSGDLNMVTITLSTRDTDTDSTGTPAMLTSSVTLDLHVTPVAGDVTASSVATAEDTAVAFLAGVAVTDTGSGATGSEVIDSISFEVPAGWTVAAPTASTGWSYDLTGTTATISFDDTLNEAAREAILDAFTIRPPAHSSVDETITLSITTTDSNSISGSTVSDTQTVDRDVKITVTPDAERTDTDSDGTGGNDVTMNADYAYSGSGKEDSWFALGTNYTDATNVGYGNAQLASPWSNADTDEFTYAVLTPTLESDTPADTVIGTQFRYSTDGGSTWVTQTYAGEAVWVPAQYLDTLQVKLPADVSGTLTIGVQAGTVDYDDDAEVSTLPLDPPHISGAGVNVDVSGSAILTLIKFDPVADTVTMALNGRASGLEDTAIPLSIKTTSSDTSETFNVTISDIPVGATITYGTGGSALTFTASAGSTSFEITDFSNAVPITVTPPLNSNDDFQLTISAVSVDGTDTSAPTATRTISVSVTGVADTAVVTLPATAFSTTEAALDSGDHKVALSNLVAGIASPDADGSEVITLRITGLAEDFTVTGATVVVSGTGEERIWVASATNLANVSIVVPENYSGTIGFKVAGVTTENDGDSHTAALTDVSFTVTPSPEAMITTGATLVEDEVTPLHLAIVQQNGDGNEALGKLYVPVDYDSGAYTLYLGATELTAAGLATTTISGATYYVVPADQVDELGAKGAANLDGPIGSLSFLYEVVDPSNDGTLASVTEIQSGSLALTITPVTDAVDASITAITMTTATGTTADDIAGDDAAPDTATITASGTVTVNLHVDSADTDGSEHLVRIVIENVPDGVTVTGAAHVGTGSWLLVYDGGDAQAIGTGGIDVPVEFIIGKGAGNGTSAITMTVQAQDEGQSATTPAGIETDRVNWNLVLDLTDGEPYAPPVIDEWRYNGAGDTEDTAFTLSSVIDAGVSTSDPSSAYTYTVTISDLPAGSTVTGMILTTVNGNPIWTATVTVSPGGDSQAALDNLLSGITITPPADSNDNNADFSFDAKLTAAAVGGTSVVADTTADMPVTPVTDMAAVSIATGDVGEGETSVHATITASDIVDGAYGTIVDGKLYVQLSTHGNDGGTLTDDDGQTLSLTPVSGVDGVPDGNYYVIDIGVSGGSVDLTYTAPDGFVLEPGDVTFTAWAQTQEIGAANTAAASASGTANVVIINNGITATTQPVTGNEASSADKNNAIELTGLSVALTDDDGSETIQSILLSGVPVGFLLYVGTSAGDATLAAQASNAGGDGTTNTWVLSESGDLPAYVAILPSTNWSGTLDSLSLVVESGETSLSTSRVDTVPLETVTVTAIANGLTIDPTISFGTEGRIIDLNLNAAMIDDAAASAAVADGSIETTTLQITGLGEYAAFYVGTTLINAVSYDAVHDVYTITGLSQDDLDDLGFVQAASALTDQDAGSAGTQVAVTAWTVESANGAESAHVSDTLTVAVTPVLATTGNDGFLWSGQAIDGKAGTDTVALRAGEDVSHTSLATLLKNVEVIDLSAPGENSITGGLSINDVVKITGSSSGTLTINGDADDKVELSSASEWSTSGTITDGHVAYISTSGATLLIDEDIYASNHISYAA